MGGSIPSLTEGGANFVNEFPRAGAGHVSGATQAHRDGSGRATKADCAGE